MNNLMIDLETMGKNEDASIVSTGTIFFTPEAEDIGQEFYTVVSLESAIGQGVIPDGDTILWWLKQSPETRAAICIDDTLSINDALSELNHFINRYANNTKYLKVWGSGATFDNVTLRGAYERAGQVCPWTYWNDHGVRTIVTLGCSIGFDPKMDMPFDGKWHDALADARHQAEYISAIWQKLISATNIELWSSRVQPVLMKEIMNTLLLLMTEFSTPNIELSAINQKYFDMSPATTEAKANAYKLPAPTYHIDTSQKTKRCISIQDLAEYIDKEREEGRIEQEQVRTGKQRGKEHR